MKILIALQLLLIGILFSQPVVQLSGSWVFKPGDDAQYSGISYDDASWSPITVPAQWETQGYPGLDGFAWYRLHFTGKQIKGEKQLSLLLGKIDDVDEVFLNGQKIGGSGQFPPEAKSEWNSQRVYVFPAALLKENNILAVRVFDMGAPGGILDGDFGIYTNAGLKHFLNPDQKAIRSYNKLTTSNGLIAAVYDNNLGMVTGVYPHIFQMIDENTPVKAFLNNLSISTKEQPKSCSYLANTHVIHVEYNKFNVYYIAPFRTDRPVFYCVVEAKSSTVLQNLVPQFRPTPGLLLDSLVIEHKPYFRKVYLFSFVDSLRDNRKNLDFCKSELIQNSGVIEYEASYMLSIFANVHTPDKLSSNEKNTFEQSVSILKMSQVSQSEVYPKGRGQILASLPPGIWNISWIRDGSYSLSALVKLGLYEEAKNYINFILHADCGYYKEFTFSDGKDYGIGCDYQVSVCRYFGNGKEESDFNAQGPNIEIDGFGLFLKGFSEYILASQDSVMLYTNLKTLKHKVADVLIKQVAGNGLIRIESGPWERHLPGKQITYTSLTAAKGLSDFGNLLKEYKRSEYQRYLDASTSILQAVERNLIDDGVIKGTLEAKKNTDFEYYDASTFEAFNFFPQYFGKYFAKHQIQYNRVLRVAPHRGVMRINGGDWYDNQEWIFLDCRIISAYKIFRMDKEAKKLRSWIVEQAVLNNHLIPELYAQTNAKYEGAIPMVGFGAGAFILTYF